MKCSDYIAEFLSKFTDHIFCGNGGVVVHLLHSLEKQEGIQLIPMQNEQCAALAADGYSRGENKLGVCIATSGPGFCNLIQGIAGAYYDSIPMLILVGADVAKRLRKDHEKGIRQIGFQEMNVVEIMKNMTNYSATITDANLIKEELMKAIRYAYHHRPGPVLIEIPDDIQRTEIDKDKLVDRSLNNFVQVQYYIDKELEKLKQLISKSKRPLIIAGQGIRTSRTKIELDFFQRETGIPIIPTWAVAHYYPDSPRFGISSHRAGNFAVQKADLIICFGTRLDSHHTGNIENFAPHAKIVVIDIDLEELKRMNVDLSIHCDLKDFFELWRQQDNV